EGGVECVQRRLRVLVEVVQAHRVAAGGAGVGARLVELVLQLVAERLLLLVGHLRGAEVQVLGEQLGAAQDLGGAGAPRRRGGEGGDQQQGSQGGEHA